MCQLFVKFILNFSKTLSGIRRTKAALELAMQGKVFKFTKQAEVQIEVDTLLGCTLACN